MNVVVIGAGVTGLGTAWQLAQEGANVTVVEQRYPMFGGSGRNGGGMRAQWATLANIELAVPSLELFHRWQRRLGIHFWMRHGGYLILATAREQWASLRSRVAFQRAHGVETSLLSPEEAGDIAPAVAMDDVVGAAFHARDGVIFPWPVVTGLYEACRALGVGIRMPERVTGFHLSAGRVTRVVTDRGEIPCEAVLNAAGDWSAEVARMAGVELPNRPVRHEILATEPLKPFLDPMVVVPGSGLYASQDGRGEILAGIEVPGVGPGLRTNSTSRFLDHLAPELVRRIPRLGRVRVLRQWAGCYDVSPDGIPILGPAAAVPNLHHACGLSGHGFMVAPMVTRLMTQSILGRRTDPPLDRYNPDRFSQPDGREVEAMVIG